MRQASLALILTPLIVFQAVAAEPESRWAHLGGDGKLVYGTTDKGDRIMDFSTAGYMGGGVKIPSPPVVKTVRPSGGDDSAAIQEAIDEVSRKSPTNGFRGAVLLAPGTFPCRKTLTIAASGVVLRGSGSGAGGTTIEMTGSPHLCLAISGPRPAKPPRGTAHISDAYVPSGTSSFHVSGGDFQVGDAVLITKPVTRRWIEFMGMNKLVRDGKPENWLGAGSEIHTERTVQSVAGNRITLDIPLSDALDLQYFDSPGATVARHDISKRISQVGVENLRIVAPAEVVTISQPHCEGLQMSGVSNGWVRDVAIRETIGCVAIRGETDRITVERVAIVHTVATLGAPKPADFAADGTQILFDNCTSTGNGLFYFVTGGRVTGPIVLLDCTFHGSGHLQPHMRWATGLLVDNCRVPEGGIDFMNRGEMGSGHGWTIGWSVAWNCTAKSFVVQNPPGAVNWAIGCVGKRETAAMPFTKSPKLPEGTFDSHGAPVAPQSLYLEQLAERLGPAARQNIGH